MFMFLLKQNLRARLTSKIDPKLSISGKLANIPIYELRNVIEEALEDEE